MLEDSWMACRSTRPSPIRIWQGCEAPQLQAAVDYLREGDVLVVHSIDRLAGISTTFGESFSDSLGAVGWLSSSRNPRGTFLVFTQAAQHLTEGGRIIALSISVLAKSFPTCGPYIASKAGVEGLREIKLHKRDTALIDINGEPPKPRPALEGLW